MTVDTNDLPIFRQTAELPEGVRARFDRIDFPVVLLQLLAATSVGECFDEVAADAAFAPRLRQEKPRTRICKLDETHSPVFKIRMQIAVWVVDRIRARYGGDWPNCWYGTRRLRVCGWRWCLSCKHLRRVRSLLSNCRLGRCSVSGPKRCQWL